MVHNGRMIMGAVALCLMVMAGKMQAQTVTLEDFDFGESTTAPASSGGLGACLLDPGACTEAGISVGAALSIDDVVNLGIIDRSEVADQPALAAASASGQSDTAMPLPSIDIEIFFDYNVADIRADQWPRLTELAQTLAKPEFDGFTIAFIGHTDAKGSADYNRDLSFRRAQSVASFVESVSGVGPGRITATGIGSDRLKTLADPFSALNRRVQLVLVPRG
ncbi:MAG: OmpA family protein [Rhodobacteraceae bacterium]|nr:OmpA family protein [Paracoccaceae bacterium]MCF8515997.1 OmpA family protein [Paracoccaceae bacterium]MCF8520336.1 OmpA family protein [Paracoccaceae bacterium]